MNDLVLLPCKKWLLIGCFRKYSSSVYSVTVEAFYHGEIVNVSVCSVLSSLVFYEETTVNVKTCTRSKDFLVPSTSYCALSNSSMFSFIDGFLCHIYS